MSYRHYDPLRDLVAFERMLASKAHRLSDVEVGEVSLVDKPANRRKWLLFKSDTQHTLEEVLRRQRDQVDERGAAIRRLIQTKPETETMSSNDDRTPYELAQSDVSKAAQIMADDVNEKLDRLAREIKKSDETFEAAYSRALQTPEGQELYQELTRLYRERGVSR